MGWYSHKFWEVKDDSIDCTIDEMRRAVHGFLGTETNLLNDNIDAITIANIVRVVAKI